MQDAGQGVSSGAHGRRMGGAWEAHKRRMVAHGQWRSTHQPEWGSAGCSVRGGGRREGRGRAGPRPGQVLPAHPPAAWRSSTGASRPGPDTAAPPTPRHTATQASKASRQAARWPPWELQPMAWPACAAAPDSAGGQQPAALPAAQLRAWCPKPCPPTCDIMPMMIRRPRGASAFTATSNMSPPTGGRQADAEGQWGGRDAAGQTGSHPRCARAWRRRRLAPCPASHPPDAARSPCERGTERGTDPTRTRRPRPGGTRPAAPP